GWTPVAAAKEALQRLGQSAPCGHPVKHIARRKLVTMGQLVEALKSLGKRSAFFVIRVDGEEYPAKVHWLTGEVCRMLDGRSYEMPPFFEAGPGRLPVFWLRPQARAAGEDCVERREDWAAVVKRPGDWIFVRTFPVFRVWAVNADPGD